MSHRQLKNTNVFSFGRAPQRCLLINFLYDFLREIIAKSGAWAWELYTQIE